MPPARYFRVFGRRSVAYEAHTFEDSLGTRVGNQRLSLNPVGAQLVESQRGHCSNCVGGEPASVARITCGKHPLAVLDNRILDICRVASDREVRIRAEQVPGAKKGRPVRQIWPVIPGAESADAVFRGKPGEAEFLRGLCPGVAGRFTCRSELPQGSVGSGRRRAG